MTRTTAQNMGLYQHHPTPAPCVRCGRVTENVALTGFARTGRPKRSVLEGVPWCQVCRCDRSLAILDGDTTARGTRARAVWTRYRRMLLGRDRLAPEPLPLEIR